MLGVEYYYFNMQLFKVVMKEQESYNRKRKKKLNNPHSNLRIDFWVYEVHLNAPWLPFRHTFAIWSAVDFRV